MLERKLSIYLCQLFYILNNTLSPRYFKTNSQLQEQSHDLEFDIHKDSYFELVTSQLPSQFTGIQ